jgi:hypothetical protein
MCLELMKSRKPFLELHCIMQSKHAFQLYYNTTASRFGFDTPEFIEDCVIRSCTKVPALASIYMECIGLYHAISRNEFLQTGGWARSIANTIFVVNSFIAIVKTVDRYLELDIAEQRQDLPEVDTPYHTALPLRTLMVYGRALIIRC